MTERLMKRLLAAGDDLGCDLEGRADYSGRGMYGERTCAITFASMGDLLAAVAAAAEDGPEVDDEAAGPRRSMDLPGEVQQLRFDSMGRGQVAY